MSVMSVVEASNKTFDSIGDDDVKFLRYRVGLSYRRGRAPKSAKGVLRFPAPPGAKFEKLYFAPLEDGGRLGKRTEEGFCARVEYWRDPVLAQAPYGELLLNYLPGSKVTFCRFWSTEFPKEQGSPFGFSPKEGKYYIPLVTPFEITKKFNPLYMRVEITERPPEYYVLDIEWGEEIVTVTLLPVEPEDCPEFLRAPEVLHE